VPNPEAQHPYPVLRVIDTASGPAWAQIRLPGSGRPRALLAIGHGAGGSVDAPDIAAVSRGCLDDGIAVAAITQPYRVAGKRAPAPAARLDAAWLIVIDALRADQLLSGLPLIGAGRSSGARVACRTAGASGAVAVIALAFPLHPPGKPDATRLPELDGAGVPVLVIQGDRDPFGQPRPAPRLKREVVLIEGADHRLARDLATVASRCTQFIDRFARPVEMDS
jgi:predicted alpha/beta-hydrolase family hydrolase